MPGYGLRLEIDPAILPSLCDKIKCIHLYLFPVSLEISHCYLKPPLPFFFNKKKYFSLIKKKTKWILNNRVIYCVIFYNNMKHFLKEGNDN